MQVRLMATDIVEGLCATAEGIAQLSDHVSAITTNLLTLCKDSDKQIASKAISSLVNLSQEEKFVAALLEQHAVDCVVSLLKDSSNPHHKLLVRDLE